MKSILLVIIFFTFQISVQAQSGLSKIKVADDIELLQLSDKAYVHISYLQTEDYGLVGANGLLLIDGNEAFLFDSPWNNNQTERLVTWIADSLHATVSTFVPNHWHADCMGGLDYLLSKDVKSYANQMTIDLAKENGLTPPQYGFSDSLLLKLNNIPVFCFYLGGGHATDNIVVWIPSEKTLFPGCMSKDFHAQSLGNLSDADVKAWPETIKKVLEKFPSVETVIPGHGPIGGKELLIHTRNLLTK